MVQRKFDIEAFTPISLPSPTYVAWKDPLVVYMRPGTPIDHRVHTEDLIIKTELFKETRPLPQTRFLDIDFILHMGIKPSSDRVYAYTKSGEVIGTFGVCAPYVRTDHRGRGLGAFGLYLYEQAKSRIAASSYSPSGLANRVAVHGLYVNAALRAGHDVPANVLADYTVVNGRATLKEPYTVEMHEEIGRRDRITRAMPRYMQLTEMMLRDTSAHAQHVLMRKSVYEPDRLSFALRAHAMLPGSRILKVKLSGSSLHLAVITAEKDKVIDIFGERTLDQFAAEAKLRFREHTDPKVTTMRVGDIPKVEKLFKTYAPSALVDESLEDLGLITPVMTPPEDDVMLFPH